MFEVRDPVGPAANDEERARYLGEMQAFLAGLPVDRYPNTVATIQLGFEISADEQFEYGLRRILDGIGHDLDGRT